MSAEEHSAAPIPLHRRVRADIDLAAFRHNLAVARALAGTRATWPVIKGDAYGHGVRAIARAALAEEVDGFCVADLDEALTLRADGVRAAIVVIQGAHDAAGVRAAAEAGLILGVHDPAQVALLEGEAAALRTSPIGLWLKLDTGMHRLGVDPEALPALRARLVALVGEDSVGTMMHFACADEPDHPLNIRQADAFAAAMPAAGTSSVCNSAALFTGAFSADAIVRPGIMLYGASPFSGGSARGSAARSAASLDLRPVMTLRSRLIGVKDIAAGETVGYGATFTAPRAMRIGLVAAGYGDGYPRHVPTGTPVGIGPAADGGAGAGAATVTTVGRVSMDSIVVDLDGAPRASVGDAVTLWGAGGPSVDVIAAAAGTIGYELLTRLPPRVPRFVID